MSANTLDDSLVLKNNAMSVARGVNDRFWLEYQEGTWEADTRAVFERFIDPEHSYVDIGAWIGPTLLLGAPLAKHAYGIEPDPIAYRELSGNIARNSSLAGKVTLFNVCIAPESGKKTFGSRSEGGDSTSSLLFSSGKTVWTVDGMSFAEWAEANSVRDCNFIKMDIEGGEYSVVPTMTAFLNAYRPTLHLSLHPDFLGERDAKDLLARLRRAAARWKATVGVLRVLKGYRYLYDPRGRAPSGIPTFMSKLRDRLARIEWKPAVLLLTCLYSLAGGNDTLVATDHRW